MSRLWVSTKSVKHQKLILAGYALLGCGLYSLIPSKFPFWVFFPILGGLIAFVLLSERLVKNPFHKVIYLLLFAAGLNSSLVFWMHEEANAGRHLKYAKALAEQKDTIAENRLALLARTKTRNITDQDSSKINQFTFWEKKWLNDEYLSSNYNFEIVNTIIPLSITHTGPQIKFNPQGQITYQLILENGTTLLFKLKEDFRKSIYSENQPLKHLKDLRDFQFAVIENNEIVLANTHVYDEYLTEIQLPALGETEKINLHGYDVLAYHYSSELYVLIGEPLSEAQVWISNFAFFFSLLIIIALFLELISLLITKKNIPEYWQEQPIQLRIQFILIMLTCSLFIIIASTTFVFLNQNNNSIIHDRQLSLSETIRKEFTLTQGDETWRPNNISSKYLAKLSERNSVDVDVYDKNGALTASSFSSLTNSQAPKKISDESIHKINDNHALVLVDKTLVNNEPYLRTHFGVFENQILKGYVSFSAHKSEIGMAPYIPIVMVKLLNVYVFLLLLSWGGGLLFISILTRPLQLLSNRLNTFNLGQQNDKLDWKGEDAIGQLIAAYNKMIDKVEETSKEIIKTEKEGAWQIMAQQIAHEINNKLTPLRLNIQFLKRVTNSLNANESERIASISDNLVEKVDSLSKVAAQFRLFAQMDSPSIEPTNLSVFLNRFIDNYQQKEQVDYVLSNLTPGNLSFINIDKEHLQEILANLFAYSEENIAGLSSGIIRIEVSSINQQVVLKVKNNGPKSAIENHEKIFDPRFSTTSSQTGLGLSICKRIIEFYKGELVFNDTAEEGNTFKVTFPIAQQKHDSVKKLAS